MRNVPYEGCGCNDFEVAGVIRNGKIYEDGAVPEEKFDETVADIYNRIQNVGGVAQTANEKTETNKADIKVINTQIKTIGNSITSLNSKVSEVDKTYSDVTNKLSERIAIIETDGPMIGINNFKVTPALAELGKTVNAVVTWQLSRTPVSAVINGVDVTGKTQFLDSGVTSNKEYTLSVLDEKNKESRKTISIEFANYVYWGVSEADAATESVIKILSDSELTNDKNKTVAFAANDQYIYYAYPSRLGESRFVYNGVAGGFTLVDQILVSNGSGYGEKYNIYRSDNKLNDEIEIAVE